MAGFLAMVDHVNNSAERAPGFVWRLKDASGNLNAGRDPREIVNLSVWKSLEDFRAFVWSGIHDKAIRKKEGWFEKPTLPHVVMWRIEAGCLPTREEGFAKLNALREKTQDEKIIHDSSPLTPVTN